MICGWGEPYQMASVPHMTRSSPTRTSNLPRACAASVGELMTVREVVPSSHHTFEFGATW